MMTSNTGNTTLNSSAGMERRQQDIWQSVPHFKLHITKQSMPFKMITCIKTHTNRKCYELTVAKTKFQPQILR